VSKHSNWYVAERKYIQFIIDHFGTPPPKAGKKIREIKYIPRAKWGKPYKPQKVTIYEDGTKHYVDIEYGEYIKGVINNV